VNGSSNNADLIPLKEFAHRLGRNVEATRRRFRNIAVERRGLLFFRLSDLERLLKEHRDDDCEYAVTRTFLSRTLGIDPRTVDKRLAHLPSRVIKGQRRYRERDVTPILEAARRDELLSEIEVTRLMGGHHFWQLHLLIDFPQLLRDNVPKVPRAETAGRMGLLWKRGAIEPWAELMRSHARQMLKPEALAIYAAAAAPLDPENAALFDVAVFRAHFDRLLVRLERIRPHEEAFQQQKSSQTRP
jgi:hypothetical protein